MSDPPRVRRRYRAFACGVLGLIALGADRPAGLLFHASFDSGPAADFSVGRGDPYLFLQPDARGRNARFRTLPGAFGSGVTGVMGSFEALGNVLPERGTIAFFARLVGEDLGEYPLQVRTLDSYYWRTYLVAGRLPQALAAWVADEAFVVEPVLHAPPGEFLSRERWRHLAVAWDQAYGQIFYLDGEPVVSSWGNRTWLSRGVDPAELALAWADGNIAYDELYVFDRALSDAQIRRLAQANQLPGSRELPSIELDARRRQNRLRELGWEGPGASARIPLDRRGRAALSVRRVVPRDARALLAEAGAVFDGKLGEGWPARTLIGYEYAGGGGLAVELDEDFDTLIVEGRFAGRVHAGRHQLEPRSAPLHVLDGRNSRTRWRPGLVPRGWLSFFAGDAATQRTIAELSFFRRLAEPPPHSARQTWYVGSAAQEPPPEPLGLEIAGRFGDGDRTRLSVASEPPAHARAALAALRFHHIALPARSRDWALRALRVDLALHGPLGGLPLQVELRDPLLPGRRLVAFDLELTSEAEHRSGRVELLLDVGPQIVPAGRPLWLVLVAGRNVEIEIGDADPTSRIETLELPLTEAVAPFIARELPRVRTLFRTLSEERPWVFYEHPERELAAFNPLARQLFGALSLLHTHAPQDERVAALWSWTHQQFELRDPVDPLPVAGHPAAPRWALLQRELRERANAVLEWWIANRQAPSGEFGDGWNDDTDLIQNFPGLALLGDPGGRLRESARAVAEGVYTSGRIRDGLNTVPFDPLHAYEEGMSAQQVMVLLDPGNPRYLERLMESARAIEERWMKRNAPGRLAFRSALLSDKSVGEGAWSYDSTHHAVLLAPALAVAYYNGNPRAIRAAREWLDGWMDQWARRSEQPGTPAFASKRHPDGSVLQRDWLPRGFGLISLFPALYALTGDARYREATRYWTGGPSAGGFLEDSSELHLLVGLLDPARERDRLLPWARSADLRRVSADDLGDVALRRLVESQLTGRAGPAEEALAACVAKLRREFAAYTWAEPISDRIWLPFAPLAVMAQGGLSHQRNQLWPQHHVSYEGLSDFAAWVREKSDTRLRIWLYSFAGHSERGALRMWRARPGHYLLRIGRDTDLDGAPDDAASEELQLRRFALVPFELPAGELVAVELSLHGEPDAEVALPDLALSDVQHTGRRLELVLHNIGSAAARDVSVAVTDAAGARVAERGVPLLEAPGDLVPRRQVVVFEPLEAKSELIVRVDPAGRVAELNEENNVVRDKMPARLPAPENRAP